MMTGSSGGRAWREGQVQGSKSPSSRTFRGILADRIQGYLAGRVPGASGGLGPGMFRVSNGIMAGKAHGNHGKQGIMEARYWSSMAGRR